jgi:poly(A) polymerase
MLKEVESEIKFSISRDLFYQESVYHLMPILTPAYPSMNSTHNVSHSTKAAIMTEFEKALQITEALIYKKAEVNDGLQKKLTWHRLFKKFNFFGAY